MHPDSSDTAKLAAATTRAASSQTFATIRLLVDRGCKADAYRAYAYFRWVDDWIDQEGGRPTECQAFVARQRRLIDQCYAGEPPTQSSPEESVLVDLVRNNPDRSGPLAAYIYNLLWVMAFDAQRRGCLISHNDLRTYQHSLAVAVTEAMHFFIGRDRAVPTGPQRYLAVKAAHITHMLRDTHADLRAGYFNVPLEFLTARRISPADVDHPSYAEWVCTRVELARRYFGAGRQHLKQVASPRCRLAMYAYIARFEVVLDLIERDGFVLRPEYSARKTPGAALRMLSSTIASWLGFERSDLTYGGGPQEAGRDTS